MAIKAGQILHDANGTVIDRIQSGGVSNLNIPEEKIYELGNYQSVATIRDTPDLSFDMESLDVSMEAECLLTGEDNTTMVNDDFVDFMAHIGQGLMKEVPAEQIQKHDKVVAVGSMAWILAQTRHKEQREAVRKNTAGW
mgnify:CR=1 FL=1